MANDRPIGDVLGGVEPTLEQQNEFRQMMEERAAHEMAGLLGALMPTVPPGTLQKICRSVIKQQQSEIITRVLDDAADPKVRAEKPKWGLALQKVGAGPQSKPLVIVKAPKDPNGLGADEALQYATILGAITNPTVRACLLALGYEPHFVQFNRAALVSLE
jgi:hypothetical protein